MKSIIFGNVLFKEMTHNVVFAGQPRRTATLPQCGHGAWQKKLVLVSVCSISICYRGADPLNRNVDKL